MSNPGVMHPVPIRPGMQEELRASSGSGRAGTDEISFLGLATAIIRFRYWAFFGALIVAAAIIGMGITKPRTYTTAASFVPQIRRSSGSSGSSLAAQFGISIGGGDPTQSSQFYVDLLTADEILRGLVDSVYTFRTETGVRKATLVDIFSAPPTPREMRIDQTIRGLRALIAPNLSLKTGVIRFTVTTRWPELSREIAERILVNMDQFNLQNRIAQAATERKFIEARLSEAETQLRAAEDRAEEFSQSNVQFGSARLQLERDRLQRDVNMRQTLYTALAQEYDRARNEELRDMPTIAILERPRSPVLTNPRGLFKKAVLGALAGALLGLIIAMLRDYLADVDESNSRGSVGEFKAVARQAFDDFRHPFRSRRRGRAATG